MAEPQVRDDVRIDWRIPATPGGLAGALARFLGPGKTGGEKAVEFGGHVVGIALVACYLWQVGAVRDWSLWQIGVVALMVFDLVGGVLTNATNSAKRWYHRPAPGRRRYRMVFVACHVPHLVAVAFLLLPGDPVWLLANTAVLLGSATLIELVPLELKRLTATALYVTALMVNLTWLPLPAALVWFPVLFFLKLLVCFMVPEAPMTRSRESA